MRAISVLTCGAALTFAAWPSVADVFAVSTKGDHVIKGTVEMSGKAVVVSPNVLLTASRAVGSVEDFKSAVQTGRLGVRSRTITIRDQRDAIIQPTEVTVGERPNTSPVAVLIPKADRAPMSAERLSACPLVDGETYVLRDHAVGENVVGRLMVLSGGQVTQFTGETRWSPMNALGTPVFGSDDRVVGLVTDAAPDGSAVQFTPIADVVDLLPKDIDIACDPRVDPAIVTKLDRDLRGLASRVKVAEDNARLLMRRVDVAEQTGNFAVAVLADVASDLERINQARSNNEDIGPLLDSMKTRLQSLKLTPTVRTINALLRRPDWSAMAKSLDDHLVLTFVYKTQLPGPGFSNALTLCLRAIKPYRGSERDHDFRAVNFYSMATTDDPAKVVKCATTNVNVPAGRQDMGQYVFEVSRREMTAMFERYREARDWVPADYVWSGLSYAALVKPNSAPGQPEGAEHEVILHMLIVPPDERQPGASAVQCKLFENEQAVIDFLALNDWASDATAFDDVQGVVLDRENTSDECVSASMQ